MTETNHRLAVLIDADNAQASVLDEVLAEIAKLGVASVKRIYGDFTSTRLSAWKSKMLDKSIQPTQVFPYTTGKNASDIALIIDAMDLLHTKDLDGFCLISSDSDFTRLASRLREEGADVYGFGAQKTPESFRQACRRFIYAENLLPESAAPEGAREAGAVRALSPASASVPLLMKAIEQIDSEDGWVGLGRVGQHLANIASDFDPRTYGYRKLSDLVRHTGAFEMEQGEGRFVRIRAKVNGTDKTDRTASGTAAAPGPRRRRR